MTVAELEARVAELAKQLDTVEKTVAQHASQFEQLPVALVEAVEKVTAMKAESIVLKGLKDLSIDIVTLPFQAGKYIVLGVRDLFKSGKKPQAIVTEQPAAEPAKA